MMVWIAVGLDIVWGVSVRVVKKTVSVHLKINIIININKNQERFNKFYCRGHHTILKYRAIYINYYNHRYFEKINDKGHL